MFHVPEHFRLTNKSENPLLASDSSFGNNGFFVFQTPAFKNEIFRVMASDGMGWEHCSVSMQSGKIPTWEMMCKVKEMFWDREDCVMQLHPPYA